MKTRHGLSWNRVGAPRAPRRRVALAAALLATSVGFAASAARAQNNLLPDPGRLETHAGATAQHVASAEGAQSITPNAAGGAQAWHVQWLHTGLAVQQGTRYQVLLRAKAAAPRSIVCAVGQTNQPWSVLGLYHTFELTTDWQDLTTTFVAEQSESNARLYLELAGSNAKVEFFPIRLVELPKADAPPVEPTLAKPAETPTPAAQTALEPTAPPPLAPASDWLLNCAPGNEARMEPMHEAPGGVRVHIDKKVDGPNWQIQMAMHGLRIDAGEEYIVRFRTRASGPRKVDFGISQAKEPWQNLGLFGTLDVAHEWVEVERRFRASMSDASARLHFDLGCCSSVVDLAGVSIRLANGSASPAPAPPSPPLAAQPMPAPAAPSAPQSPAPLPLGWSVFAHQNCAVEFVPLTQPQRGARAQGIVCSDATPWNVRLTWGPLSLVGGQKYQLHFRARADQPRTVIVDSLQVASPWANLGLYQELALGTNWQDHTLDFTAPANESNAVLNVNLGSSAQPVEISDLELNPPAAAPPAVQTLAMNPQPHPTSAINPASAVSAVSPAPVNPPASAPTPARRRAWVLATTPGNVAEFVPHEGRVQVAIVRADRQASWHIQLHKAIGALKAGERLELRFRARAEGDRPMHLALVDSLGANLGADERIELGSQWRDVTRSVTIPSDSALATLELNFGDSDVDVEVADATLTRGGVDLLAE